METCENHVGKCGSDVRTIGNDVSETLGNVWGRYVDTRVNYAGTIGSYVVTCTLIYNIF